MTPDKGDTMPDWITTKDASIILGVSPRRVRQLVTVDKVIRRKMITTRLMLVNREDVEKYKRGE